MVQGKYNQRPFGPFNAMDSPRWKPTWKAKREERDDTQKASFSLGLPAPQFFFFFLCSLTWLMASNISAVWFTWFLNQGMAIPIPWQQEILEIVYFFSNAIIL